MSSSFSHGYALLIGVGESAYPKWSLPVTVNDVRAIHSVLTDIDLCAYPYDADHVRLLSNAGATKQGILEALTWLKERTDKDGDATAFVFYSGHGWLDKTSGKYYLIPHDVKPFNISGSALSGEEFTAALRQVLARRLLVFIDSCHAAGMATSKKEPELDIPELFARSALPKSLDEALSQGGGRAVFSSSTGEQLSWIRPDLTLSVYAYHLLEALQGAACQPGDTVVRISHLMTHLARAVPASAQKLCQAEQTPFFDTATEDFAVALLRGGKGLPQGGWAATQQEAADRAKVSTRTNYGIHIEHASGIAIGDNARVYQGHTPEEDQD